MYNNFINSRVYTQAKLAHAIKAFQAEWAAAQKHMKSVGVAPSITIMLHPNISSACPSSY